MNANDAWEIIQGKDVGTSLEDVGSGAQMGTSGFETTEGIAEDKRMVIDGKTYRELTELNYFFCV